MKDFNYSKTEIESTSLQVLPDAEIPTLGLVLDPCRLRKRLRRLSRQWTESSEVRVQVLRFQTGRRCTFEIAFGTPAGPHALIGKVYALDGAKVFETMRRINLSGFGPEAEFSIPQPVAYLTDEHLLLQERVQGRLAKEIFLQGSEDDRAAVAEQCARWLARFHAIAPKFSPAIDPNACLLRLEQWLSGVALSGHPLSEKAEQLFHCLERAAPALERRKTCACHGDFSPAQVILGEGRIATCDWDSYCVADRHYDVARFLTALEIMARKYFGSVRALDASADVFLRTYATFGKPISASNLQFYKAAHHLKLIRRKLVKPYWRQRIEATLDDSLRMLEPMTA